MIDPRFMDEARAMVERLVAEKRITLRMALQRAEIEQFAYTGFVETNLRYGYAEAAAADAVRAAECALAAEVLQDIADNPEPYREVRARLAQGRKQARAADAAAERKDEADRARRKHFGEKRQREKMRAKP